MSGVRNEVVEDGDDDQRLDRWLRSRFPALKQGKLQKLLRTGQVRVDGARAKANDRVSTGQTIRIPPNINEEIPLSQAAIVGGMDIEQAGRLGDELKERNGFCIRKGYERRLTASSQFGLTLPAKELRLP